MTTALARLGTILLLVYPRVTATNVLFKEIEMYHNETSYKADYAYRVVSKIYNAFHQWFFTITFCEFTYFENRILKYTEAMDGGCPVILMSGCPNKNRTRTKPKINTHGETVYIISSSELNFDGSEYIIEAMLRTGVFKPRTPVIFILNVPVTIDSYFFYTLKMHFQLLWSRRISNSVVIILWSDELWTYTYNQFLDKIEDITTVKDIYGWLTRQYDDLHGHELRLSVFKKIYHYQNDFQPLQCDSRLAVAVMRQLNATCKALGPRDGSTVGDLLPNGTSTGVTGDLIDGYTDLELNSRILKNSYYGYIDTTYPFTNDELCFMVKNYEKQSTFSTIIQLISVRILVIFMFNVITLIVIAMMARELEMRMWKIKRTRTAGAAMLELVKCFIKQTVDVKLPAFVYRCIVLMIIIYSLIVDCVIEGTITSAITYPRYSGHVNTMEELISSNLTLAIHHRHFGMFNQSMDDETYSLLVGNNRIEIVNDKKIGMIIEKRQYQYALMLRKTDLLYITRNITKRLNGRPLYRIMSDCPLPCFIVYGLRYGSPYRNKINDILHHLTQGGILQLWAKAEEFKDGNKLYNSENKELRPLTIANLQELFIVWAIGLAISTIVFIIEIFISYKKSLRAFKMSNQICCRRNAIQLE